jgi:hypothetical protein
VTADPVVDPAADLAAGADEEADSLGVVNLKGRSRKTVYLQHDPFPLIRRAGLENKQILVLTKSEGPYQETPATILSAAPMSAESPGRLSGDDSSSI